MSRGVSTRCGGSVGGGGPCRDGPVESSGTERDLRFRGGSKVLLDDGTWEGWDWTEEDDSEVGRDSGDSGFGVEPRCERLVGR